VVPEEAAEAAPDQVRSLSREAAVLEVAVVREAAVLEVAVVREAAALGAAVVREAVAQVEVPAAGRVAAGRQWLAGEVPTVPRGRR
jgi:hypothetical protein